MQAGIGGFNLDLNPWVNGFHPSLTTKHPGPKQPNNEEAEKGFLVLIDNRLYRSLPKPGGSHVGHGASLKGYDLKMPAGTGNL